MLELNLNNFQAEALEADQPVLVDFLGPLGAATAAGWAPQWSSWSRNWRGG